MNIVLEPKHIFAQPKNKDPFVKAARKATAVKAEEMIQRLSGYKL